MEAETKEKLLLFEVNNRFEKIEVVILIRLAIDSNVAYFSSRKYC